MLSAEQARFETKFHKQINEVMDRCEENVQHAILEEIYSTSIDIDLRDTVIDVCSEVMRRLKSLGYKTELRNNGKYYAILNISWKEE